MLTMSINSCNEYVRISLTNSTQLLFHNWYRFRVTSQSLFPQWQLINNVVFNFARRHHRSFEFDLVFVTPGVFWLILLVLVDHVGWIVANLHLELTNSTQTVLQINTQYKYHKHTNTDWRIQIALFVVFIKSSLTWAQINDCFDNIITNNTKCEHEQLS